MAIVGPTTSGKSALALKIAQRYNGEIIAADSRTIYKGMDIGTAKPTTTDQQKVPHWGLDLVKPGQRYSAYEFKEYAKAKIKDIKNRDRLPVLVGGTGLYIDAVLFDFDFPTGYDPVEREKLEKLSTGELQTIIRRKGYPMPVNYKNRRHLIRTIERSGRLGNKRGEPLEDVLTVGLLPPDKVIKSNITKRAESIINQGLIEETRRLVQEYGQKSLSGTAGIAYSAVLKLIKGEVDEIQAVELIKNAEWQYARRQKTWFKRNPDIQWFGSADETYRFLSQVLNN